QVLPGADGRHVPASHQPDPAGSRQLCAVRADRARLCRCRGTRRPRRLGGDSLPLSRFLCLGRGILLLGCARMSATPVKVKRPASITVEDCFRMNEKALKLKLVGSDVGFARKILEPSVNRPGLALSGFFTYFAYKRVQVVGNSEHSFLSQLEPKTRLARFSQLCT